MGESFKGVFRGGTWIEAQDGTRWYDLRGARGIEINSPFDDDVPQANQGFDVVVVYSIGKKGEWTSWTKIASYRDREAAVMVGRSIMTAMRHGEVSDITLPQDSDEGIARWQVEAKTRGVM